MERISETERIASFSLALANARDLSHGVAPELMTEMLEAYFPSRKERTNDRTENHDGDSSGTASAHCGTGGYCFWLGAEGHPSVSDSPVFWDAYHSTQNFLNRYRADAIADFFGRGIVRIKLG